MNKAQLVTVFAAVALFAALYFGFDTKPDKQKSIEQSRSLQGESTSFETLLEDALAHLNPTQAADIAAAEKQVKAATDDPQRIAGLKNLSGLWYEIGQLPIAGGFAEQVAELENADSSWSVAGGTFFTALVATTDPTLRQYCASHAVKAFESAASLAPEKVEHRVNLALVWAENPPPNNPMQAVLMLRDLESKYPESPAVYNALGRLAIKTGQWQRATERLEKSWSLDKKNPNTPCLLAKAYEGAGNIAKATEFAQRCKDAK
jgi:tetratricopeptide (TPR) repeat protein